MEINIHIDVLPTSYTGPYTEGVSEEYKSLRVIHSFLSFLSFSTSPPEPVRQCLVASSPPILS